MKIVVVEDEVLVRRGIVSGIPWAEHGIEVVGDASDGRTGLELVRSLKPDMVITDIQMPIMDGLEMIRHIRKEFPDMIVMILSVREDFRSVQDAIRLGVIDYVHKLTMSPEELLESVLQAKDSRSVQEKPTEAVDHGAMSVSSNSLTDWLEVATADNEPAREEGINGGRRYSVGIIRIAGDNREHLARLLLDSTAHKGLREAKMHHSDREAIFIATDNGDEGDGKLILERWKDDLADAINRLGDEGQCLSVAISPLHLDKQDKLQAYHEALEALSLRFYTGPGYVHVHANRVLGSERDLTDSYASFVSPMAIRAYLAALEQTDEAFARLRFEELFPLRPPEGMPPNLVRDRIVQWQSSVTLLLGEWGLPLNGMWQDSSAFDRLNRLETYPELREWCLRLHTVARELWDDVSLRSRRSDIEQAIRWIKEKYNQPLRLQDIAAQVNLSENYFSYLFSKNTGQTFVHYLQQLRVQKAKELMRESSLPWFEIGERVGFDNPKYFAKIFKRFTRLTPAQYQRNK